MGTGKSQNWTGAEGETAQPTDALLPETLCSSLFPSGCYHLWPSLQGGVTSPKSCLRDAE